MRDPLFDAPDRSLAIYVAAEHASEAASAESALTAWAILALVLVLAVIAFGGCA